MRAYVPNEQGWICSLLHKVRYLKYLIIIFVCMCRTFPFFLRLPSPICQGHKASPPWEGHNAKNSSLRFSIIYFFEFGIFHFAFYPHVFYCTFPQLGITDQCSQEQKAWVSVGVMGVYRASHFLCGWHKVFHLT
jgi:hypothetical protein